MLLRLFVSNPAAQSRTNDNDACATTSDFCVHPRLRPVERLAPRRASAGSAVAVIQAGATPNTIPVSIAATNVKPSTGKDGVAWIATKDFLNARCSISRVPL